MEAIKTCKINYGFHYKIHILFTKTVADENMHKILEGWSECVGWDEHTFTSTNPYTGEVFIFPMRNIARIYMEVLGDDSKG